MSTFILKNFEKKINDAINDKVKFANLKKHIINYMDKNHEVIFAQGPMTRLLFTNRDQDVILEFVGVTEAEVKAVIKQVPSIKASWQILNNPFYILSCYMIRDLDKQKRQADLELILMYMSLKIYSGLFPKYFKHGVNQQIMAFTLNDLSDKFKYKAAKNNYGVIKDVVFNSHQYYEKKLLEGNDEMLNDYLTQIFSRLNKIIMNIAKEYYNNRAKKNYLNTVKTYDDESGNLLDYENSTGVIQNLAEGTVTYFMSSNVDLSIVQKVAVKNSIPSSTVYQTLASIRKNESPTTVKEFMTHLVGVIYDADPALIGRVCTTDFAITALKQLSVSNSSNQNLIALKDELDRLLSTYSSKYAMTQRLATKMSYRNALYSYFVFILIINHCK